MFSVGFGSPVFVLVLLDEIMIGFKHLVVIKLCCHFFDSILGIKME
jgi:hypothetical protein